MNKTRLYIPASMQQALTFAGTAPFTGNDLAKTILQRNEKLLNEKKTKAFIYNQLRKLLCAGILHRRRLKHVMQYEYTKTALYYDVTGHPENVACEEGVAALTFTLEKYRIKYQTELNRMAGEKEVLEEFRPVLAGISSEFSHLFYELDKKISHLTGKIDAIDKINSQLTLP
ncbi:TPA: hypothetical protein JAN03_11695 [Citrobacter freundii]|nr:hypothetical protein [Citrobacter freundii]